MEELEYQSWDLQIEYWNLKIENAKLEKQVITKMLERLN